MDVVLGLRLRRVQGLQRVGVVVAEHAGAVDGRRPVLLREPLHQMPVPAAHLLGRAAPIAIARVQHVVLEVLELGVGCLGALQIELGMRQEEPLPQVGVDAREMPQCVERQLVMRAGRVSGVDDAEKKVHGRFGPEAGKTPVRQARETTPTIGESHAGANADIPRHRHASGISVS